MTHNLTTLQGIFDTVKDHLLKQNARSERGDELLSLSLGKSGCAYRGQDGLKCAIGCLIPDEDYEPRFEGQGVDDILEGTNCEWAPNWYIQSPADVREEMLRMLGELQCAHDNVPVDMWPAELGRMAHRWNLEG